MQANYFSPSVNIQRDRDTSFYYIPTRNSERAFQKIVSSFEQGTRSFNIIGAYGSGKSAFIVALDKVLNKKASYFHNPIANKIDDVESTFIIGEFTSFKQVFIDTLGLDSENIWVSLKDLIVKKNLSKTGLLWVVDEFGKFLEYAAKENPEELYFIQQLAEFVNSQEYPILFITTLHQAFEDYALDLTKTQRKEWEKVKGRLLEISFNEPVEQLLFLASEKLSQKGIPCQISNENKKRLFDAILNADVFPLRNYLSFEFSQKLFPFDVLSAALTTVAFQRYGQNERSLFTLMESRDYLGLNDFLNGDQFYNVSNIYDYLKYNFHGLINSKSNQDSANWKALDEAIQRTESLFDLDFNDAVKILKTIGLTAILGRQGQKLTKNFLVDYSQIALGINDPQTIIEKLETKQIIRYRNYSQRYVLFKGTDIDLSLELELAESIVSKDFSIVQNLQKHFNFPIVPAKRVYYEKGTPRYFLFEISENPVNKIPEGSVDGYINIVFNKFINEESLLTLSSNSNEAILYGLVHNVEVFQNLLFEIEKIQLVKNKCINDAVAVSELNSFLDDSVSKLNEYFLFSFYGKDSIIKWFYNGEQKHFDNSKSMNRLLSDICNDVYSETPVLKNELINREKLSGTIASAKKKLILQLLNSVDEENLGFDSTAFPPEKTIYLALLKKTGIHRVLEGHTYELIIPNDRSFDGLWNLSERFLLDCSTSPKRLSEFIDLLRVKPLKLKQGFIDFWIPIFMIAKKSTFALYEQGFFVPDITDDTLEVAMKQPQKYTISTFSLDERKLNIFNRYRNFLNLIEVDRTDTVSFIETIKPFLVFYRKTVPFTKETKNLTNEALRLKDALSAATNPEKVFFEDIPRALGYTINDFDSNEKLESFSLALQNATRELSSSFPNLINRIEDVIGKTIRNEKIDFPENKSTLQQRFKKVKNELVDPKLRVLIQRINTPLEDRQSWINSIATAIIGKSLDQFTDQDEVTFNILFQKRIHDLDNFSDISNKDIDESKEELLKIELTSFVRGVQQNFIRFPKEKNKQIDKMKTSIKGMLNANDKQANIVLLIKLLQEEIEND